MLEWTEYHPLMPCDHLQPEDIMSMAEAWLRDRNLQRDQWRGTFVHHAENTPGGMWGSVVVELERRGDEWIVTRLDRNREPMHTEDCGLRVVLKGRGQKAEG